MGPMTRRDSAACRDEAERARRTGGILRDTRGPLLARMVRVVRVRARHIAHYWF